MNKMALQPRSDRISDRSNRNTVVFKCYSFANGDSWSRLVFYPMIIVVLSGLIMMDLLYMQGLPLPATPPINSAILPSIYTAVDTAADTTGRVVRPEGMTSNNPARSGDDKGSQ